MTFVITASVYVDNVDTPEEAEAVVQKLNEHEALLREPLARVFIRLPDDPNEEGGHKWEESGQEVPG